MVVRDVELTRADGENVVRMLHLGEGDALHMGEHAAFADVEDLYILPALRRMIDDKKALLAIRAAPQAFAVRQEVIHRRRNKPHFMRARYVHGVDAVRWCGAFFARLVVPAAPVGGSDEGEIGVRIDGHIFRAGSDGDAIALVDEAVFKVSESAR